MEILIAESAGFCFGVDRAVQKVYDLIEKDKLQKLYTYGPIIHNKTVIQELEEKGVQVVEDVSEAKDGLLVIRSHGVAPYVYEALEKQNIPWVDCTCPFVKKIHKLVRKEGHHIVIGDPNHPEVMGILGWAAGPARTIANVAEAKACRLDAGITYNMVVQTTFQQEKLEQITDILIHNNYKFDIHNTICSATAARQFEAKELSRNVDIMFVIGDKKSSNTRKLFEICQKNCQNTQYIETIHDLELNNVNDNDKIGITAGASTPSATIKEVIYTMNVENQTNENSKDEFQQMLDETLVTLHSGDIVKGTVIGISNDEEVSVNLGYKSDGIIERGEFSSDPSVKPSQEIQAGDEIEVYVQHVNDREGSVLLSKKRLDSFKGLQELEKAYEEKTPVEGKIVEIVKGGAIALSQGARIFIPASQLSDHYVEDLNQFKGQDITFEILEMDQRKRRYVGGRRELLKKEAEAAKKEIFGKINEGDKVTGRVARLTSFGAFVDLGGVDGLIHISELSWGRVNHPSDVLKEGDTVEVTILKIDQEKEKISLSLKDIQNDPWVSIGERYKVGEVVEGKVVRMVPFGAFIELEPGVDGLVHISQIDQKHVVKPEDFLSIGQTIQVKILDVNAEQKQMSLSKKEADGVNVEEGEGDEAEVPVETEAVETNVDTEETAVVSEENTEE